MRAWAAMVCSVAVLAAAPGVRASGIATPGIASAWSGVSVEDPAAIHFNPANLAGLTGFRMQLNGGLIWAHATYERHYRAAYQYGDSFKFKLPLAPEDIDPAKTGAAEPITADELLPIGSLFASYSPVDDFVIGIGVYAPYGATLNPPDDGPQRYHIQEALLTGLYVTPSFAYKPVKWFQFGAGVSLVLGQANLRQIVDLAATSLLGDALADPPLNQPNDFGADAPPGVRELDVLSRPATLETSALGVSFNVGLTFHPDPDWTIGLTYQHGADLVFKGDAWLDMNHDFFTRDLAYKGLQYPALVKGNAYLEMPLPPSIRLGIGWQISDRAAWHLDASVNLWSVQDALRVTIESPDLEQPELGLGPVTTVVLPRESLDTIEIETHFSYFVSEDFKLGARLGYHSPASPDATLDLSSIDGHRIIVGIMGSAQVSENVGLGVHALLHQVVPREVTSSRYDRGNGVYSLTVLNVGGTIDLRF